MKRLSIIIPMLDERAIAALRLRSLQPYRERGAELIVVDGGSTDGSIEIAIPLADRVLRAPRGRAIQMNAGAATASGEILLFLHLDTVLPPNADSLIADALADAGKGWGHFSVALDGRHPALGMIAWFMNRRSRLSRVATGDQAIFVRRAWFDAVGGYAPIRLMEDIALSKSLRARGQPAVIGSPARTSGRRWEQNGVVRTIVLMWWLRLRYFLGADPDRLAAWYEPR